MLALKTSPTLIVNPPENFIPTRKPKSLSQTENPAVIIKVSNHLNPHPSHIIVDPPGKKKKKKKPGLSIIISWSTNPTTTTIINKVAPLCDKIMPQRQVSTARPSWCRHSSDLFLQLQFHLSSPSFHPSISLLPISPSRSLDLSFSPFPPFSPFQSLCIKRGIEFCYSLLFSKYNAFSFSYFSFFFFFFLFFFKFKINIFLKLIN